MFRGKIRSKLSEDFKIDFDVVDWGYDGCFQRLKDNTIARRLFGARKLEKRLLGYDDATEKNRRYIVTHSHGGNVTMYALRNPDVRKKLTGIICLSSPFLVYELTAFNRNLLGFSALILLFYAWFGQTIAWWAYAILYLAVAGTILVSRYFRQSREANQKVMEQKERLTLAGKEGFSGKPGQPYFLAIRPHRDEVAILFWITNGFGAAFRWLWEIINRIGGVLISIFMVYVVIGILVENIPFITINTKKLDFFMSQVDQLFLSPLILSSTAVLLVIVVMRWSYAFDSLPWIASLDVRPKIVPWVDADKEVVPILGIGQTHKDPESVSFTDCQVDSQFSSSSQVILLCAFVRFEPATAAPF